MPTPHNFHRYHFSHWLLLLLLLSSAYLGACSSITPTTQLTSPTPIQITSSPSPAPTTEPAVEATTVPLTPRTVLVVPPGANLAQADRLQETIAELSASQELEFEVTPSLSPKDLISDLRVVIAVPPDPGLADLATRAPDTQFVGIAIPGLQPSANLTVVDSQGSSQDQQGFLAGYLAALITPEWRVGAITVNDTPAGLSARQGFLNGVVFFCGLCRQTYPPFYTYPMYVELPGSASPAEWQAAADVLIDKAVQTVYVAPGAGGEKLLEYLAKAGIKIIGAQPPTDTVRDQWVATIQPDFSAALRQAWPDLVSGNSKADLNTAFQLTDINPDLLSSGRQRLAEELMDDLQAGTIDTAVGEGGGDG